MMLALDMLMPGPYLQVPIGPGASAPFYALRYDDRGRSTGPLTEDHLIHALEGGPVTDVFVFSHGWNNDWESALDRYRAFMAEYRTLRETHHLAPGPGYRPILVGVFWPSTALVMPWEEGPDFAADDGARADRADLAVLSDLAGRLGDADLPRFYELSERRSLTEAEARELLRILAPLSAGGDPDLEGDGGRDADEMLAAWARLDATLAAPSLPAGPDDIGPAAGPSPVDAPLAAGFLDRLDPRNLVRGMTVWQMKDRAGRIGAGGVGTLLRRVVAAVSDHVRIHLIGHSYGARVLLTALTAPATPLARPVDSLLLLQPAVNHLCFADRLPSGRAGGFRAALALVRRPILSTFSVHDRPLHDMFHLALRRGKDLGEAEVAGDEPPSEYAALGGYGPRGFPGWREVAVKDATDPYDLGAGAPRVWAVNGSRRISGHGDVVNPATAWALHCLARG